MARPGFRNLLTIFTLTLIGVDVGVAAERRAQQVAWSDVHSAVAGAKIKMVLPSGTEIQGRLLEVGPEALTMDVTKTSSSKEIGKGKASIPCASVSAAGSVSATAVPCNDGTKKELDSRSAFRHAP
jgi:hypothetical protein